MGSRPDSEHASTEQAKQQLDRAKREAGHLASNAADAARRKGREGLDQVKDRTASRAEEFADVIDATADDLESRQGGEAISEYGHSMASMMRRLAGGLREREIEEFASQLAGFARRSPGTFLAGSVALGFGVSRFLKATSERPVEFYGDDQEEYLFDEEQDEYLFEPEEDIDTTLQTAESPDVSSYTAGDRWPEDDGRERPGAGSPTQHTSPAASQPPDSEYSLGATGAPAAKSGNLEGNSNIRGDEYRRDNLGRDNLGGTDRE